MNTRIDKWLWAVRIFKTRTDASEACRKGHVLVNNVQVKPSRDIKTGDVVTVKRPPVNHVYNVVGLVENRQPAKNVPLYAENVTPQEELDMLKIQKSALFVQRDRGTGRPTKKERRELVEHVELLRMNAD
ncbi:MAG: RNA-binding S4 domain-containing protein [Prevotellaceae bacterium]|jgi:ribosome-associated heat shock protein Hsp15|nr:RNA-binding S4 domain-containing protein [Prevotellaceae bacterium]